LATAWILRLELKRCGFDQSVVIAAAIAGLLGARLLFILEESQNFRQRRFSSFSSGPVLAGTEDWLLERFSTEETKMTKDSVCDMDIEEQKAAGRANSKAARISSVRELQGKV